MYIFGLTMFAFGTCGRSIRSLAGRRHKDHGAVALGVQRGQLLSVIIGVLITLLCIPAEPVFRLLRQRRR
jgi:Na+-driven multidrug efflux pump